MKLILFLPSLQMKKVWIKGRAGTKEDNLSKQVMDLESELIFLIPRLVLLTTKRNK